MEKEVLVSIPEGVLRRIVAIVITEITTTY